jgi:hypothetical protein
MNQKSAFYNGVTFVDIDGSTLPTDFDCDRIPNKGDVMSFKTIVGNKIEYYHCVVLYIYDQRTLLSDSLEGEVFGTSIYVITKRIYPELGEKTWISTLQKINELGENR